MAQRGFEFTPDGWMVADLGLFRYLVDHPPPRPSRIGHQLGVDARHWLPWLMWTSGFGIIALAIYLHLWAALPIGIAILVAYFRLFNKCISSWKDAVVYRGTIDALKPHPLFASCAVADARLDNGEVIPVAFHRELVAEIMIGGKPAEIIFNYEPKSEYGGVIGARAVSKK